MRFLALGDSYTIGEGVSDAERWPNQLATMLRDAGVSVEDPHIIARTAWTTDELADAIAAEKPSGPFDLVSLLVGVNDQYRGRPIAAFESEFTVLLRRAASLAGRRKSRIVVIAIPDWGASPFAAGRDRVLISREIAAYNARARELTTASRGRWVDITDASRRMLDDASMIAADGLHPSGKMYGEWARIILPTALDAVRARR